MPTTAGRLEYDSLLLMGKMAVEATSGRECEAAQVVTNHYFDNLTLLDALS